MAPERVRGILHGASLSPFVRKVRGALALKGVEYELVHVMPGAMEPAFLAKSPLSKIPVWEEPDGFTLPDSSVICDYLEQVVPDPPLYPADPRERAQALFWEEYADTRLVDTATPIFFQRVVRGRIFGQPVDESLVRRHAEDLLPPVLDQLEALFAPRADALAGRITIATLSVWAPLSDLGHADVEVEAARWPALAGLLSRLAGQPALARVLEEDRALLASF